jgi:hypothetical protein
VSSRVKWHCPLAAHSAVLAPTKPRRDDVRRYCLACSEATGRLVPRIALALEKARAKRAEIREVNWGEWKTRQREREAARYTVCGVNLKELMAEYMLLPAFRGTPLTKRDPGWPRFPTLVVRRRTVMPASRVGCASYSQWRIIVNDYPGCDEHAVRQTLLHELCHLAAPGKRHGVAWRTVYRLACEQAFGVRPTMRDGARSGWTEVVPKLREAAAPAPAPEMGGES